MYVDMKQMANPIPDQRGSLSFHTRDPDDDGYLPLKRGDTFFQIDRHPDRLCWPSANSI